VCNRQGGRIAVFLFVKLNRNRSNSRPAEQTGSMTVGILSAYIVKFSFEFVEALFNIC
jgi:hypothetical protein